MDIDEFLDTYPENIKALSQQLRGFVKTHHPDCEETLHVGWRVIAYTDREKVCAIAPHANWVNLQFHRGAGLADPSGLLEGTGEAMRHVKIRSETELSKELVTLINEAFVDKNGST